MALPGRSLGRRLLSPVAARLDARATSRAQLAIDRYHRQTVEPLRSELERLRGQVDAAATHAVYVPALTPDQRPPAEGFMAASTCAASDFLHPRFAEIVSMLHDRPRFHRKLWEHVFIVHHLLEQGVLEDGRHGIGFGVGTEVLPAVFAAAGSRVTATDAPSEIATGAGWTASGEFAAGVESLANPGLVEPDRFRELVDYRTVDMNAIGPDLSGHDFAWSACCFEHLGSLRRGIDFVIASTERCLKPGGIGVHTTEFNLSSNDDTLERPEISFYRRRDIEELADELTARGHRVSPIVISPTDSYLDGYVDVPPYHGDLHLKLAASGYTITSIGIVVERGPG